MTALSVSIVNTNSRELLLACLESLRGAEAEIVVLDNASEDGSAEAVRERFPDVRLLAQDFRAGFGANHNTVIRATSGRYVYVLNEDTTADDWGFDRLVAFLDSHPRVAALGPRLLYPGGRLQDSAWRFPTPLVSALGLVALGKVGVKQSRGDRPRPVDSQFSAAVPERRINEMWRSRHRYWRKHHSAGGARVAALFTGAQYAARAALSPIAGRDPGIGARMRLHARDAWRVSGPGLRELADEWNGRVGTASRR